MFLLSVALAAPAPPVVGGAPAPEGAWPDAAAVYFRSGVGCTGTLITPDLVLTAGHCADGIVKVKVGATDYTDSGGEEIPVAEIHEYPDSQRTYDVTLLVLDHASTVPPRPLALDCILDDHLHDGATIEIVGYGATNPQGTRYPTTLYEAESTVTDADCSDLSTGCQRSVSPGGEVAAGGDGVDSCYGDSGGPLYLLADGDYYLVGVTSRGVNGSSDCGVGGIYVRPDAILDWIESTSGETIPRPDCTTNQPPAPTAEDIAVEEGGVGTSQVEAHDPDAGDHHTFTVVAEPEFGTAVLSPSGFLTYNADGGPGNTRVVVSVQDDGDPTASATVTVEIAVSSAPDTDPGTTDTDPGPRNDPEGTDTDVTRKSVGGCGCASTGSPGAGWLLAGVALWARRRTRQRLDQAP